MSVDIRTHRNGAASDPDFQAFVQAVQAAILTTGLTKTADTGQINSATVTNPAINTMAGYEIYKFNDTLQATQPVLVRVEYWNGATTGSHGIKVAVGGGGSDGAGLLQTPTAPSLECMPWAPAVSTQYSLRTSGSTNRICLFGGVGTPWATGYEFGFSVERSHNDDGTDSNDGIFLVTHAGRATAGNQAGSSWYSQYVPFVGAVPPATTTYTINASRLPMPWYDTTTMIVGLNVGIAPLFMPTAGLKDPSFNMAGYHVADISNDAIVTLTQYGATKTYRTMGSWCGYMDNAGACNATSLLGHGCMMRWE